jgi:P-type Ca2+ transporter type 2C
MGITGTEVAKEASDMVLADDNFATIVKAVEEGRSIYSNMKAFIRYLISSNIGEVASIFLTAMLGVPEGFTSVQLLWVNLVTDGPPATALGFNPPDRDVMKKPPRRSDDQLISKWTFIRFMVIGIYVGIATVGVFIYWYLFASTEDGHTLVTWNQLSNWSECPDWKGFSVNNFGGMDFSKNPCEYFTKGKVKASTLSLSVLVVIEMLNAMNALSEDNSLLVIPPWVNPWLLLAIVASVGSHLFILYVPFMNQIFGIVPLNLYEWKLVLAFAFPVILIDEVLKFIGRIMNESELKQRLAKIKADNNKPQKA